MLFIINALISYLLSHRIRNNGKKIVVVILIGEPVSDLLLGIKI